MEVLQCTPKLTTSAAQPDVTSPSQVASTLSSLSLGSATNKHNPDSEIVQNVAKPSATPTKQCQSENNAITEFLNSNKTAPRSVEKKNILKITKPHLQASGSQGASCSTSGSCSKKYTPEKSNRDDHLKHRTSTLDSISK